MPPKTVRKALAETLEDLSKHDFDKFRRELLDRREEPRIRRNRVEDKNFLDVADVLVSTFTESGALQVSVELLRQIGCNEEAECLVQAMREQSSKPGSSDNEHFVDKHRVQLIQRVSHIAPILDELLARKVISHESYDDIRFLRTSHEKMRAIHSGCLKAGRACKDIFYEILEENEPFLIADLKAGK